MVKGSHHTEETRQKIRIGNTGKHLSEEAKQKDRKAHIGKRQTEESNRKNRKAHIGNQNAVGCHHTEEANQKNREAHTNKHPSEETRQKISRSLIGKRVGKKCNFWRSGKTTDYISGWGIIAKAIRQRDNYLCAICGKPEPSKKKKLCVHHIDLHKDNNDPFNLVSICTNCHLSKIHVTMDSEQDYEISLSLLIKQRYGITPIVSLMPELHPLPNNPGPSLPVVGQPQRGPLWEQVP